MHATRSILVATIAVLFSQTAYADNLCVAIDEERDNLSAGDRQAAIALVEQQIEEAGHTVAMTGCPDAITMANVKLGTSITVTLKRGDEQRRMKASGLDDLPNVYSQMVPSIISGEPITSGMDRTNVTKDQAKPKRAKADFLTTFRGGVMKHAAGSPIGPNFGAGMRIELDTWAVEAEGSFGFSFNDAPKTADNNTSDGSFTTATHIGAIYFFDGLANSSPFLSGGIGYGITGLIDPDGQDWSGAGFDFRIAGGYELLRASTIRMFIQAEALIPAYLLHAGVENTDTDSRYNPTFLVSFGIGYQPDVVVGGFLFSN